MLYFRDLGVFVFDLGCFVFEIWVLRASVFVFECFVFETTIITATKITPMGQIYTSSDRLSNLCVLQDTCNKLFCVFGDFYESGTQDAEVTKSLLAEDCY